MKRHRGRSLEKRAMDMVRIEGECWIWTGFTDSVPRLRVDGKSIDARSVFRPKIHGEKRHRLIKTCSRIECVNPEHNLHFYSEEGDLYRFWENVDVQGPDECWEWKGSGRQDSYGDGRRGLFRDHMGISTYAYRWIMSKIEGYLGDAVVMHKCDNGNCVNPNHLLVGTQKDNVDDMISKWRHMHGEAHTGAVLNDGLVREIRSRHSRGEPQLHIANDMGVDKVTVWSVVHLKTWRHVQ